MGFISKPPFTLPPLPYDENALAPAISARTLGFHHGKHHKTYIDKTNELVKGKPFAGMALDEIVRKTVDDAAEKQLFNNAAQAWNHAFYWNSLSPEATQPSAALQAAIDRDCAGMEALKSKLEEIATDHFASGWAWLTLTDGVLETVASHDGDTPMAHGATCLLAIDVWEHAYYLDYQNDRKKYVKAVVGDLLNWDFASQNFES
jgi:Fe-Mn family superoxide dismutase